MNRVFLGGTCNESTWREQLIPMLNVDYFDPVVDDWTPECTEEEIKQRNTCDYVLYTITPKMTGVYSIAEAVDDSNKRPNKTIFCVLTEDVKGQTGISFNFAETKSLLAVCKMLETNGAHVCFSLEDVAKFLND